MQDSGNMQDTCSHQKTQNREEIQAAQMRNANLSNVSTRKTKGGEVCRGGGGVGNICVQAK